MPANRCGNMRENPVRGHAPGQPLGASASPSARSYNTALIYYDVKLAILNFRLFFIFNDGFFSHFLGLVPGIAGHFLGLVPGAA